MGTVYCTQCGEPIELAEGAIASSVMCSSCGTVIPLSADGQPDTGHNRPSPVAVAKTSGMAIAALVCGILGFGCFVGSILGIIFACIAFGKIRNSQGRIMGKGLATGGLVVSIVFLIVQLAAMPVVLAILMPALGRARELAEREHNLDQIAELGREIQCRQNLLQIGNAIALYLNDFEERMPPDLAVLMETEDLAAKVLVCPLAPDEVSRDSYIYRGADLSVASPTDMILAYESLDTHHGRRNVLFVGNKVESLDENSFFQAIEEDNRMRREAGLAEKLIE